MQCSISRYSKLSLGLFGTFAIGYNLSNAIHELGHALAMWLGGGRVKMVLLHPFSWSYTYYLGKPPFPATTAAAGVLFSTLVSLCILVVIRRRRSDWLLPLVATGLCTFIVNAIYLGVDSFMRSGGDGTYLLRYGFPLPAIIGLALLLLPFGAVFALILLPRLGLKADDGIWPRLPILFSGIGSYLLLMLAYNQLANKPEIVLWTVYVAIGFLLITIWAVSSPFVEARWNWLRQQHDGDISWVFALSVLFAGVVIVAVELLFSDHR